MLSKAILYILCFVSALTHLHLGKHFIMVCFCAHLCSSVVCYNCSIKLLLSACNYRPTLPIGSEMIGLVRTVEIMYNNPSLLFKLRTQDYLGPLSSMHS